MKERLLNNNNDDGKKFKHRN